MQKELQIKKNNQKMHLLTDLIEALTKYNAIEGYDNQKKFTVEITYRKKENEEKYYYNINILRGMHAPKNIFNMRFISFENINHLIENLINQLTTNEEFSHTSFSSNFNEFISYNINLKNNIEVKLAINTEKDLKFYNKIEENFINKEIIISSPTTSNKTKDELQEEKMTETLNILKTILNILEKYNNIEDYKNKKPFIFKVNNYNDKIKDCYVFTFTIIRGTKNSETFLTLNASIKNKEFFYDKIYDMLMEYKQKESFLIDITANNNYKSSYIIKTNDDISLEFAFEDDLDNNFYNSFIKETNAIREENDIFKTKIKTINSND